MHAKISHLDASILAQVRPRPHYMVNIQRLDSSGGRERLEVVHTGLGVLEWRVETEVLRASFATSYSIDSGRIISAISLDAAAKERQFAEALGECRRLVCMALACPRGE